MCVPLARLVRLLRVRACRDGRGVGGGGGPAVGKLYFQVPNVPLFWQQLRRLVLPLFRGLLISAHFCPQFRRLDMQMVLLDRWCRLSLDSYAESSFPGFPAA